MASERLFTIEGVTPDIYINDRGQLVNGHTVRFFIPSVNEEHTIKVAKMDKDLIASEIERFVTTRLELTDLG